MDVHDILERLSEAYNNPGSNIRQTVYDILLEAHVQGMLLEDPLRISQAELFWLDEQARLAHRLWKEVMQLRKNTPTNE